MREIDGYPKPQLACKACVKAYKDGKSSNGGAKVKRFKVYAEGYLSIGQRSFRQLGRKSSAAGSSSLTSRSRALSKSKNDSWDQVVDKFKRRFIQLRSQGAEPIIGECIIGFKTEEESTRAGLPALCIGVRHSTIIKYDRNCFPRVKNAFHFGVIPKHDESIEYIFEAETEEQREQWMRALTDEKGARGMYTGLPREADRVSHRSVKEGFLEKMGKVEKETGLKGGWRVRYFLLDFNPSRLEYFLDFSDAKTSNAKSVILLGMETMVNQLEGEYLGMIYSFVVTPKGGRRYVLSAGSAEDCASWVKLINEVRNARGQYFASQYVSGNMFQPEDLEPQEILDEEETNRRLGELTQQQRDQIDKLKQNIEKVAEERKIEISKLAVEQEQVKQQLTSRTDLIVQQFKRVSALRRIEKKDTQLLEHMRGDLDTLTQEVENDHPMLAQIETEMAEDTKTCEALDVNQDERRQRLAQLTLKVEAMERERKRLDELLIKFAHMLE